MLHQFKTRLFIILLICVFTLSACGAREESVAQGDSALQEASPSDSQTESTSESVTEPMSESTTEIVSESATEEASDSEIIVMSEEAEIVENPTGAYDGAIVKFYVELTHRNYTITNAEGETLKITDGRYSGGTMQVLGRWFYGERTVTLVYRVPFSESFTFSCDNSEKENYYLISWGEQFAVAKGTGMEAVTFTQSNIQVTGDDMEYLVRYTFEPEASYKAQLSGRNETFASIEYTGDGFRVSTQNEALMEVVRTESRTTIFSEAVAATGEYFLNYKFNEYGIMSFESA